MDKHFSLYLDLVRLTAAVLVVLCHYTQHGLFGTTVQAAGYNLGRESVIVFFLLSGFVIAWSSIERAMSLRQYVVARSARIYSVALPLLLAAYVIGMLAAQQGIEVGSSYQLLKPYVYVPLHLLFAGELWILSETPPWLEPYWSLGYEVWYYVLFGVAWYARGWVRIALLAVVLLVMGPKLWLLLPVWLAGAVLYRYQRPWPISAAQARLGWWATLLALAAYKLLGLDLALRALGNALWPFPGLPLGSADRFLCDYVVCAIMYAHFVFARQAPFAALERWQGPIRALAAYTFTLYLVHALVMGLWMQIFPPPTASAGNVVLLTVAIGLATYACGFVTERRRDWFRRHMDALFVRTVRPAA